MVAQTEGTLDETRLEEFGERVAADQNAGVTGVLAYIGDRLGLWRSLADAGPVTPEDLARSTGLDPSYLSEWLASQAAAQYVEYEPDTGRFHLPAEHALVLADDDSPAALVGGFEFQAGCWADADRIVDLFVTGEGLSWGERDPRLGNGVARFFRPLYRESLVQEWLPALDGVIPMLEAGARVLDVGCGQGSSTILIGQAFPNSEVVGLDPDRRSVAQAQQAAQDAGTDNVSFREATATDVSGEFDLICFFDAFHHLGNPRQATTVIRDVLATDGALMLVEPLSLNSIEENLTAAGPLYYGPSTIVCLPDAMSQSGGVALGAQAGPQRIIEILTRAGFSKARVAKTTDFNLVIEARN